MSTTDLALAENGLFGALADLEKVGAVSVDPVSLTIVDANMSYDAWEGLGRAFGHIDRSSRWWIAEWLLGGEALFGEGASQGIEATTAERYSESERVTGLDHGTLMNMCSVARRVPRDNRREQLPFAHHTEVAPLPVEEQGYWLDQAIENGWSRRELRDAIRESQAQPPEEGEQPAEPTPSPGPSRLEQIEDAAWKVWRASTTGESGDWIVPADVMVALATALGEY